MMNCKQAQTRVLAGVGSPDVERHLAGCAECRAFARAYRVALGAAAECAPSAALDARIQALARERLAGRTPQGRGGWRLLTPEVRLALAASAAVVLSVSMLMMAPDVRGPDVAAAGSASPENRLLAWDMDPLKEHGVQAEPPAPGNNELGEADLAQIERCMDRVAGQRH